MNLGRSSFLLFLMQVGRSILLFLAVIYFARQLSASQLGSFFLFQALLGLLSIPADLGVRGALEKRVSEGNDPERMLGSALLLKLALFGAVSLGILLAQRHINQYLGIDLAVYLVLALFAGELTSSFVQTLRGELRVGETAAINFANRLIWVGLGALLVTFDYGVRGIVLGVVVAGSITSGWAYWRVDTKIGRPSSEHVHSLFSYSKYHAISSVGGRIYQWLDLAVIGLFLTQAAVSRYEVAWQVTLLVLLVSKSVGWVLFPQVSRWDIEGETDKIEWVISRGIALALFVSVPSLIGGIIFAADILSLLFGPEYVTATAVLVILLVEKVFGSVNDIAESCVRGLDRPDLAAKATVITVAMNLVLNPLLVVSVGLVGAAIATTLSIVVLTALHVRYLLRLISFEFPYTMVGWYLASSLAMGAILAVVRSMFPPTNVVSLFAVIGLGVVVYFGFTFSIPRVRNRVLVPAIKSII